jgi:hypothetical protein
VFSISTPGILIVHIRSLTIALTCLIGVASAAKAADPVKVRTILSHACTEAKELVPDIFGFSSGSDVGAVGSWAGAIEYGGAFGTRMGSFANHSLKFQVATSPMPCLEIGPSIIMGFDRRTSSPALTRDSARQAGVAVEVKYKVLSRSIHGIGLTIVAEPSILAGSSNSADFLTPMFTRGSGAFVANTTKFLFDAELVPDTIYAALNLEHTAQWTSQGLAGCATGGGFCRASALTVRAAISTQVMKDLFFGLETAYARAHDGIALNRSVGSAWFVGPNMFWQINEKVSLQAAYSIQVSGNARGLAGNLNLRDFSRSVAKLKLGFSF